MGMGELDFNGEYNARELNNNKVAIVRERDDALPVKFKVIARAVEVDGITEYKNVEIAEIKISKNSVTHIEVDEDIIRRFPRHYEQFKKGLSVQTSGTPLDQWPALLPAHVATLKSLDIFSVEQLALSPDQKIALIGADGHHLKAKAKAYVSAKTDSGEVLKLAKVNEELKDTLSAQAEQIEEMKATIAKLAKEKTKKTKEKEVEAENA